MLPVFLALSSQISAKSSQERDQICINYERHAVTEVGGVHQATSTGSKMLLYRPANIIDTVVGTKV